MGGGLAGVWRRLARWRGWQAIRLPLAAACVVGGGVALGLPLWSGWWTGHVQQQKAREFRAQLQAAPAAPLASPDASPTGSFTALPPPPAPGASALTAQGAASAIAAGGNAAAVDVASGQPLAFMDIPAIGVETTVLEGLTYAPAVWTDLLRDGPAHVQGSALPGQPGNMVVFGHLNIWGAVFMHLDQVAPGDLVQFQTTYGAFTYRLTGSQTIAQTDFAAVALRKGGPATLQLVTCEGALDQQRLLVQGTLVPPAKGGPA